MFSSVNNASILHGCIKRLPSFRRFTFFLCAGLKVDVVKGIVRCESHKETARHSGDCQTAIVLSTMKMKRPERLILSRDYSIC